LRDYYDSSVAVPIITIGPAPSPTAKQGLISQKDVMAEVEVMAEVTHVAVTADHAAAASHSCRAYA
jgi:hypothetical protein